MKKATYELSAIFSISSEMIKDNGEDSFYYGVDGNDFLIGAFDGLGGAGSKKYGNYSGKTGAYVASRAVNGAVKEWFSKSGDDKEIVEYINKALAVCGKFGDKAGRLRSSLTKDFPTTAAIVKGSFDKKKLEITCYWAGDSRCYLLDDEGLHQLTADDLDGQDAMSNLTNDGIMTNVISASNPFELHMKKLEITHPCILLASTDGCFGYLKSPMHFEHMLTNTLLSSESMGEWKRVLDSEIKDVTGDDHTLCAALCGFDSFKAVQETFKDRNAYVKKEHIDTEEDLNKKWEAYKKEYSVYL